MKSPQHWAVVHGELPTHAIATYQVTNAVPGARTVYRASFDFGFELPSPDSTVVVDAAAAHFAGSFQPLDFLVPAAAISGSPPVVTLDGPREVRRVAFTSGTPYNGRHVQLFRLDQQQIAPKETVSATVGGGNSASGFGGFTDLRFAIKVPDVGPPRADISAVTVRGAATGGRLGIADPDDADSLELFWPTPDQVGTSVSAGEAFGNALQAYLAGKAGDPTPTARLVIQGDQPCTFVLTAFDTAASFAVDGFGFPALVASDLTDAAGLAARIAAAGDPVSAFLRAAIRAPIGAAIGPATLLDGLNEVIAGASIYEPERFAGVTLGPQTQVALLAGADSPRANRLLLQDAFPEAVAAPAANRVLRFAGGTVGEAGVAVRLPPGATISKAQLSTQESLAADRPGTPPGEAGAAPGRSGVHVGGDGTTAVSVAVSQAISATGVALPLVGLVADTAVSIELQEDFQGSPSGKSVAAGTAALPTPGAVEQATLFFDPVVLAARSLWLVLRAVKGEAVWLAAPSSGGSLRMRRTADGGTATETALPNLTPVWELYSRSGAALGAPASSLAVGTTVVEPQRDGDRSTYDLAAALQAHAAAGGTIPITLTSPVAGTITVYPPHVEYEL